MRKIPAGLLLFLFFVSPALAADADKTKPDAYVAVMQAQYAARQTPPPISAAEAQRVYDVYLRSIGKPVERHSQNFGSSAESPSH